MEATMKIICYDGKKKEEAIHLHSVKVGTIDTRLFGVFDIDTNACITDIEEYVIYLIEEKFGFMLNSQDDVRSFLSYMEKKNTSFKEWFENYMKEELRNKAGLDYDKMAREFDAAHPEGE